MTLRKGNQEPTFSTVKPWAYSDGDYAVDTFAHYGVHMYPSQAYEMNVFLARNNDGSYAARTICISKPRQNGKSYAARFYAIWMAAIEGKNVLFTTHHGKTVRKMFKEIRTFIESTPDLYAMLMPKGGIYAAAGTEGIYFADEDGRPSGHIEFSTRTNAGARGDTCQVIIVDEAQELTADELEALKPTTIAADDAEKVDSDPQMIYLGTPPNSKCIGTEFKRWHDEAHTNRDTTIWWLEWAAESIPDMSKRDDVMELVYKTNPAMGYRIKESTMYDVMDTMSADGFARECLGWWSDTDTHLERCISSADWSACKVDKPRKGGSVVAAVKFSPDGSAGVVAECHYYDDDETPPFVYVKDARSLSGGIQWFVDEVVQQISTSAQYVVIDGQPNAQTLNERVLQARVPAKRIVRPKVTDAIAAYSALANAVKERAVTHYGQPGLDDSALLTTKRRIGHSGGWGFASTAEADASLIEACALAFWCASRLEGKKHRKAVIL